MTRRLALIAAVLATAGVALPLGRAPIASASLESTPNQTTGGLAFPWEVVPLPDGRALVTERSAGRVRVIEAGGALRAAAAFTDTGAYKVLGLALSPDFANDHLVYLYETRWMGGPGRDNQHASRVITLDWDGTDLANPHTIFDEGIWSDGNHDGGRIAFGPDGKLYVTTGDVHDKDLPQDLDRLNGKILRLNPDGSAPSDNPFPGPGLREYVWSYGHRHPEGIAWDADGRMWETEHGPSMGAGPYTSQNENTKLSRDEINRIEPGCNYGWPVITGEQTAPGMSSPVVYSGTTQAQTWAPGGLAVGPDDRLYVPALYGQHLRSYPIDGDTLGDVQVLFKNSAYGRLRTAVASGTSLWLTTSNSTGASPAADQVLRFSFAQPVSPIVPVAPAPREACPGLPPAGASSPGASTPPTTPRTAPPTGPAQSRSVTLAALRRALAGQARALERGQATTIARSRRLRLVVPALSSGVRRLEVTLTMVRGRAQTTIANGSVALRGRRTVVVLRTRARGRRALAAAARSHRRVTLVLAVRGRGADGRTLAVSRRLAVRGSRPR